MPDHLAKLEPGDLIIFDRGYFSYLMLYQVLASEQHGVFRLQQGTTNPLVTKFLISEQDDTVIEYAPSTTVKYGLKKRGHTQDFQPLAVRLVKCKIGDETHVYATTLMDQTNYSVECFFNLYHGCWGIEELYKVSKQFIDVEDFHSQTERGVKHEIYGHFLLINLARLFETDARNNLFDDGQSAQFNCTTSWPETGKVFKINFKHCLLVVGRHLEELLLVTGQIIAGWLDKAMAVVARISQRNRPGRRYPRRSFKPRTRWNSFGVAPTP
ncbi:MAG: transposase [Pseudomonadota bacterium]